MCGVQERCVQRFGWGETERKREFGRKVCRCERYVKIDFKEITMGKLGLD